MRGQTDEREDAQEAEGKTSGDGTFPMSVTREGVYRAPSHQAEGSSYGRLKDAKGGWVRELSKTRGG